MRAGMGGATLIGEGGPSARVGSCDPLVAGCPADAVALAELGHRVEARPYVGDEVFTLVHGARLIPGHGPTSGRSARVAVSTMFPVYSVTYVPGLYRMAHNTRLLRSGHSA